MTNSKQKGKRGELEVVEIAKDAGFPDARRSRQYKGAVDAADLSGIPDLHVEVKYRQAQRLHDWLVGAYEESRGSGDLPVVAWRKDRTRWLAVLDLSEFMNLWKALG